METLTSRLSRPEAFGPVSAWGPEVFTEIGTLAGTVGHNIPRDINIFVINFFFFIVFFPQRVRNMGGGFWVDRSN